LLVDAEKGDVEAQYSLGHSYYEGKGVRKNNTKAVFWYTKAAEQGNARAQYELALCYFNGIGVERNSKLAHKWFTKATEQGHKKAKEMISECDYILPQTSSKKIHNLEKLSGDSLLNALFFYVIKNHKQDQDEELSYLSGFKVTDKEGHTHSISFYGHLFWYTDTYMYFLECRQSTLGLKMRYELDRDSSFFFMVKRIGARRFKLRCGLIERSTRESCRICL